MDLHRWTPLIFLFPRRYVTRDSFWMDFDLETWSEHIYEWTSDPWNGLRDFARRPSETIADGRGDCEDYALVAASWAIARGRTGVGLAFCWERPYPWPTHVITYDDERVYSSGEITQEGLDEWIRDSRYVFCIRRPISSSFDNETF